MMNTSAAGMYKPQYAAADDIAIACDCAKCREEALTAAYWADIDAALVAFQSGRLDVDGFSAARFFIHTTYKENLFTLRANA